jgi:hypothetical protein
MFSALNEAVNKLMDGFFQQQEENRRLHKRCDDLQEELREMKARLLLEHEEFERRIEAASSENLTLDHVLVGYIDDFPVFVHRDVDEKSFLFKRFHRHGVGRFLIIESLQYLKNFKFDIYDWSSTQINDTQGNTIYNPADLPFCNTVEIMLQNPATKKLYNVCKDLGIKFVINGSDSFNGVPIDKILS